MTFNDEGTTLTADDSEAIPWTRLAVLAMLLAGLGPLMMLVVSVATGSDFDPFFIITIAVAALAAFLAGRRAAPLRIVAAVLAFLFAGALFWTAFSLANVSSFFDFLPAILVIPGALVAIVCCIASVVAARRGGGEREGERRGMRIAFAFVGVLALLSAVLTLTGKSTADSAGADATVAMDDFEFVPEDLAVEAGSTIHVKNDDLFHHTFTVDSLDIDEDLGPGSSVVVTIPDDAEGEMIFYCKPHTSKPKDPSKDDMAGSMTVA